MFTALTLSLALGAPVPPSTAPVATGTAPRVMELKADANGKVMVPVTRTEKLQGGVGAAIAPAPGNAGGIAPAVIMQNVVKMVEIGEVKDLVFTTADGMKVEAEAATKKLAAGAIVVITNDGKPVSPAFLKVFKDDTLVLVSPELINPVGGFGGIGRPGIRPLPAPIQGGGGVIQIQPGIIQIAPAVPAVEVEAVPVPVNKVPQPAPVK